MPGGDVRGHPVYKMYIISIIAYHLLRSLKCVNYLLVLCRRNQNFHDILRGLSVGHKGYGDFDLTNQFHHMFFLGDLNYRIQWHVPVSVVTVLGS